MAEKEVLFHDIITPDRNIKTDIATAVAQHADTSETFIFASDGQIHVVAVG